MNPSFGQETTAGQLKLQNKLSGGNMFTSLIEILKIDGYAIHGFQKCADTALQRGLEEPDFAAAFFLLSSAAEHFVNFYDRQPLSTDDAEMEFSRFESYIKILEAAFSSNNAAEKADALNSVAKKIIEHRID